MLITQEKTELDYASSLSPAINQKTRAEIAAQVNKFLRSGGRITELPSAPNSETQAPAPRNRHKYSGPDQERVRWFKASKKWRVLTSDGKWVGNYKTLRQAQVMSIKSLSE